MTWLAVATLTALGAIPVDGPPGPKAEIERQLGPATTAVEEQLGPVDWTGVTVYVRTAATSGGGAVPDWAAAFAVPATGRVVLRWDRIGSYPYGSPLKVLTHELAHIALARRLGDGEAPRWFDEGVAMSIAEEPGAVDAARVALNLLFDGALTPDDLDQRFQRGQDDAQAAYTLSRSLVAAIEQEGGPGSLGRIADLVRSGLPFERAVREATGAPLNEIAYGWARRTTILYRWVPILTSATTLWVGISLLALVAYARRRRRDRALAARWALEDALLAEGPEAADAEADKAPSETVH